jgi:hypothetical protein
MSWDEDLMFLQSAFHTAKHESTCAIPYEVMSPFWAVLHQWGINKLHPHSCTKTGIHRLWAEVRRNLFRNHQIMAQRYNKGRTPNPFKIHDLVFCRNHPLTDALHKIFVKLSPWWHGPVRVDCFLTPVMAKLVDPTLGNFITRACLSQMKPASGA